MARVVLQVKLYLPDGSIKLDDVSLPLLSDFTFQRLRETIQAMTSEVNCAHLKWKDMEHELIDLQNDRDLSAAMANLQQLPDGKAVLRVYSSTDSVFRQSNKINPALPDHDQTGGCVDPFASAESPAVAYIELEPKAQPADGVSLLQDGSVDTAYLNLLCEAAEVVAFNNGTEPYSAPRLKLSSTEEEETEPEENGVIESEAMPNNYCIKAATSVAKRMRPNTPPLARASTGHSLFPSSKSKLQSQRELSPDSDTIFVAKRRCSVTPTSDDVTSNFGDKISLEAKKMYLVECDIKTVLQVGNYDVDAALRIFGQLTQNVASGQVTAGVLLRMPTIVKTAKMCRKFSASTEVRKAAEECVESMKSLFDFGATADDAAQPDFVNSEDRKWFWNFKRESEQFWRENKEWADHMRQYVAEENPIAASNRRTNSSTMDFADGSTMLPYVSCAEISRRQEEPLSSAAGPVASQPITPMDCTDATESKTISTKHAGRGRRTTGTGLVPEEIIQILPSINGPEKD